MGTIKQIADLTQKIKSDRKELYALAKRCGIEKHSAGSEHEYQFQGLIGGIESLALEVGALAKAERTFLSRSTFKERTNLATQLQNLSSQVEAFVAQLTTVAQKQVEINPSFQFTDASGTSIQLPVAELVAAVEALKPMLRTFRTKETPERFQELSEQVSSFIRAKQESEAVLAQIGTILEQVSAVKVQAEAAFAESRGTISQLQETVDATATCAADVVARQEKIELIANELSVVQESAAENAEKIQAHLNETAGHSAVIDQFAKRVESRNSELDRQASKTTEYEKQLSIFATEQREFLSSIKETLAEAHRALGAAGEVALGSHFKTQYEQARRGQWLWIVISVLMFGVALYLGFKTVAASGDDSLAYLKRFTLVPLALLGAFFGARQFEKQRAITEDYAHKKVLALSITSFREQLSRSDATAGQLEEYLQKVLMELQQYPMSLRSREKVLPTPRSLSKPIDEFVEQVKKIKKVLPMGERNSE